MARTREDIERDLARARRHANEPCGSFEDRHVERDIVRQYERELSNYKEPERYSFGGWREEPVKKEVPRPAPRRAPIFECVDMSDYIEEVEETDACPLCGELLDWQSGCYDADYSCYCSCGRWTGFVDDDIFTSLTLSKGERWGSY